MKSSERQTHGSKHEMSDPCVALSTKQFTLNVRPIGPHKMSDPCIELGSEQLHSKCQTHGSTQNVRPMRCIMNKTVR